MNRSYKELIRTRLKIIIAAAILGAAAMTIAFILKLTGIAGDSTEDLSGMLSAFAAFIAVITFRIIRYSRVLKDDRKLKQMEIAEFDELGRHIRLNASRMCIWLMIILLAVAAMIAYFFSRTAAVTLGFVLIALLLLYGALKLIYTKIL